MPRIVITRPKNPTGGMSDGSLEYSVVDWPKGQPLPPSPVPNGDAYEVPDETPLSGWNAAPAPDSKSDLLERKAVAGAAPLSEKEK